jgi:hypothetical protein
MGINFKNEKINIGINQKIVLKKYPKTDIAPNIETKIVENMLENFTTAAKLAQV